MVYDCSSQNAIIDMLDILIWLETWLHDDTN